MKLFPEPWKFTWSKDSVPKIVDAEGKTIAVLSTGTIEGPFEPEEITEVGELIVKRCSNG